MLSRQDLNFPRCGGGGQVRDRKGTLGDAEKVKRQRNEQMKECAQANTKMRQSK